MRVFSAKGSSLPVLSAARLYSELFGRTVKVSVCDQRCTLGQCGPGKESHGFVEEVSREPFDLAIAGAESDMDDLEGADLVMSGTRTSLGLREAAILVPSSNPKAIHSLADLTKPGVRIAVSTIDCLRGVWEDVSGRANLISHVARNISLRVAGCMAIVDAIGQARVDAAFGWASFTHFHPRIRVISLAPEHRVVRSTCAAVVKTAERVDEARTFLEFLAGTRARGMFRERGWVVEDAQ